jgi:hypothetical protein
VLIELRRFVASADALVEVVELDTDPRSRASRDAFSVLRLRPTLSSQYDVAMGKVILT